MHQIKKPIEKIWKLLENSNFKESEKRTKIKEKEKVMILQLEDREDDVLNQFMNHNKNICKKNNLEYVRKKTSTFHVPPYWGKVFELRRLMDENPQTPFFMWMDSDAFFINFTNEKFTNFIQTHLDKSMIISKDMPPWSKGEFNAGVFIVKNDSIGKNILEHWISLYKKEDWTFNGSWSTHGEWAGEVYEQGSFKKHVLPKYRQHIKHLDYYYLNNNNPRKNNEAIAVHLAGSFKNDKNTRNIFFKPRIQWYYILIVLLICIFFILYFK